MMIYIDRILLISIVVHVDIKKCMNIKYNIANEIFLLSLYFRVAKREIQIYIYGQ